MKNKIEKVLGISICLLLVCSCGKVSKLKNGEDAVVSFKNNQKISVDELYKDLKNSYGVYKLVEMMDDYCLHKEYGSEVTDEMKEYADSTIKSIKEYYPNDDDYLNYIQSNYGVEDEAGFKEYIYINYLRNKAVDDYAKKQVTDEKVQKYYDEEVVGDVRASHILIKVEKNDDMTDEQIKKAEDKAKKKAEEVISKLNEAKDVKKEFKKLAKEYSDDTTSKEKGGDVGYFNKIGDTTMVEEFTNATYNLKDNEYTKEPVKTSYGYHIILRTGSKEKAKLSKLKSTIKDTLAKEEKTNNKTIQIDAMTDLRKKYDMKIEDSELESQYGNYIQYLINQTNTANDNN